MEALADPAVRDVMGARGARARGDEHGLEHVAELYAAALEEAAGGEAVRDAVLREVSVAAAEVGFEPASGEAAGSAAHWTRSRFDDPLPPRGRERSRVRCRCGPGSRRSSLVSAAIRFALARRMPAPWIMVDELIYSELAKSFAAGAHFLVRDQPAGAYGFVYPLLIAPAYRALRARSPTPTGRAGDQLDRHVARRRSGLLARAESAPAVARVRGRRAHRRDPVARLHRHADDRERVLSDLPLRSARAGADARAADGDEPARPARALRRRVRDAAAGARPLSRRSSLRRCCSGRAGRCRAFACSTASSSGSRWSQCSRRPRAGSRRSRSSAPTRRPATRATPWPRWRSGCSGTSPSSICISASRRSPPSCCSRSRGGT